MLIAPGRVSRLNSLWANHAARHQIRADPDQMTALAEPGGMRRITSMQPRPTN